MSDPGPVSAALVPIKGFASAKARLAGAVEPAERSRLATAMAAQVLRAAAPLPVWVVTDDAEVAGWAVARGAGVCWRRVTGLDAAVTEGVRFLAGEGVDRVVVAHADLPRARALAHLLDADPSAVVLVPDRHRDGSNVLVVPARSGFRFAYGPGSAHAHGEEARRLGLPLVVVDDPDLAWDVDVADDLSVLERSPLPLEEP